MCPPLPKSSLCYTADMPPVSQPRPPVQLELPLHVTPTPGFKVTRVENHIVLTPRPVQMWGSVKDAAAMMRRCERWVRMLAEAGVIPARRLPGAKKWDINLIELQAWIESGQQSRFFG